MALQVLIADGNEVARRFAARVVRDAFSDEVELTECTAPQDALGQLAAQPTVAKAPWLVLLDIELPSDGAALLLAALRGTGALRVVTTLYSDDDAIFPLLGAGADGFLLKEDRYEVQVEQLQRLARGEPPISPGLARRLLTHLAAAPDGPGALSSDETAVLSRLAKGFTRREIAQQLRRSTGAVAKDVGAAYRKLHRTWSDPGAAPAS